MAKVVDRSECVAMVFIRDLEMAAKLVANPALHGRLRECGFRTTVVYAPGSAIKEYMKMADRFIRILEGAMIKLHATLREAGELCSVIHLVHDIAWDMQVGQAAIVLGQWEWTWINDETVAAVIYFVDPKTMITMDNEIIRV